MNFMRKAAFWVGVIPGALIYSIFMAATHQKVNSDVSWALVMFQLTGLAAQIAFLIAKVCGKGN